MSRKPRAWWRSPIVHLAIAPALGLFLLADRVARVLSTEQMSLAEEFVWLLKLAPGATVLGYVFAMVLGVPLLLALRPAGGFRWFVWLFAFLWLFVVAILGMAGLLPAPVVIVEAAASLVLLVHSSPRSGPTTRPTVWRHDGEQ